MSCCTGQGGVSAGPAGIRAVQQPRRSQRNPRTLHSCLNVKRRGTLERQATGVRLRRYIAGGQKQAVGSRAYIAPADLDEDPAAQLALVP